MVRCILTSRIFFLLNDFFSALCTCQSIDVCVRFCSVICFLFIILCFFVNSCVHTISLGEFIKKQKHGKLKNNNNNIALLSSNIIIIIAIIIESFPTIWLQNGFFLPFLVRCCFWYIHRVRFCYFCLHLSFTLYFDFTGILELLIVRFVNDILSSCIYH